MWWIKQQLKFPITYPHNVKYIAFPNKIYSWLRSVEVHLSSGDARGINRPAASQSTRQPMHAGLLSREGYRLGDFCLCSWGIQGEAMRKRKIICWVQGSMLSTRIPSDDWWKHHPFSFDIRTYTEYSNQILGNWKNHAKCNNAFYSFLQMKVNQTYRDQVGGIHSNYQASLQIVSFGFFPKTGAQFMLNLGKHCKI